MSSFKFLFFGWLFASQKKREMHSISRPEFALQTRAFRGSVRTSCYLHSFAPLRNWLRQPLQSLPRFVTQILEIEPNKWLSFVKGFGRRRKHECYRRFKFLPTLPSRGRKKSFPLQPRNAPDEPFRNFKLFFILRNRFYFLFRKMKLLLKMRNNICIMSLWKYWKERIFYKNW